jgi:hypothetical protein
MRERRHRGPASVSERAEGKRRARADDGARALRHANCRTGAPRPRNHTYGISVVEGAAAVGGVGVERGRWVFISRSIHRGGS